MGRRSEFTPAQKRDAVLAVLTRRKTVSEVCRELGVSETSFARWREKALAAMEDALADKAERSGREARLEAELAGDPAGTRPGDVGERAAGKALRGRAGR